MLQQIERQLPDLTRAERRVAEWVLKHPRRAVRATLAELADATDTSEPTVIRFCRRLGIDGFRSFTLKLSESLSRPVGHLHRDVAPDDDTDEAAAKVIDASIHALESLRRTVGSQPLDAAVAALEQARQIVFTGLGASGHVASDACHKFFRLGIPCTALTDTPGMLQMAAISTRRDVLVIISARGDHADTAAAARRAAERQATVIAITDPLSELARAAKIVLGVATAEDTSVYTPMSSRLAHLALLDALLVALALSLGNAARENLRASKTAIVPPPRGS